ncbi:MAG: hypothetical protein ACTSVC_00345, partial [Promethearchaeota archaeon]
NMPDPRYMEMKIPLNDGSGTVLKFTQWLTPTPESALLMLLIYIGVLLVISYVIFRRRQI